MVLKNLMLAFLSNTKSLMFWFSISEKAAFPVPNENWNKDSAEKVYKNKRVFYKIVFG